MATLSELNKREREIKGKITVLRREFRDKKITKKDFDKSFESRSKELEKISEEKTKLIGLPPAPPPPPSLRVKPTKPSGGTTLDSIKKAVSGGDVEPPGPPLRLKPKPSKPVRVSKPAKTSAPKKPKAEKTVIIKEKIKEVPVFKERIRKVEVPVIKEKIKEVPVFKEKIKEVPVIKTVEVPSGDSRLGARIEEVFKDVMDMKSESTRIVNDHNKMVKDIERIDTRLHNLNDLSAEVKIMRMRLKNFEEQGMGSEINEKVEENTDDIKDIQMDANKLEKDIDALTKESASVNKRLDGLESVLSDINELKKRLDKIDFKALSKEIYSQFEKMNDAIDKQEKASSSSIEKFNVELKSLSEKIDEFNKAREHIERLDIPNMRRDMETISQKNKFIEEQLHTIDVQPLVDMVKGVEEKVRDLQTSSALIIE